MIRLRRNKASLSPGVLAPEPAFVALVDRGQEVPNTRTALANVTRSYERPGKVRFDAGDLYIPCVFGEWDSLRFFNADGKPIGDSSYGPQRDPYGGEVQITWPVTGLMIYEVWA